MNPDLPLGEALEVHVVRELWEALELWTDAGLGSLWDASQELCERIRREWERRDGFR